MNEHIVYINRWVMMNASLLPDVPEKLQKMKPFLINGSDATDAHIHTRECIILERIEVWDSRKHLYMFTLS